MVAHSGELNGGDYLSQGELSDWTLGPSASDKSVIYANACLHRSGSIVWTFNDR